MLKVFILSCSHRKNSISNQISRFIARHLDDKNCRTDSHDLGQAPLPLWSDEIEHTESRPMIEDLRARLKGAEALVCTVPEYSGMASPAFKNFILYMSDKELGHKPALLVTVSAGRGGSYPIAEARMSSYKNTRLLWIPDHAIIRRAAEFPDQENVDQLHRLTYSIELLMAYAKAMTPVRKFALENQKFPFGV